MKSLRSIQLATLALAVVLGGTVAVQADDAAVQQRVESRLAKAGLTDQGDIRVAVSGGAVTLTGAVTTVEARSAAERTARKESKTVQNRIEVLPLERSEAEIRKAVTDAILGYARYSIFDAVGFELEHGIVTLRGSVLQPYRAKDIERRVGKVAGLREVRNEVQVQSPSLFDDQLRFHLARVIYGDDRFVQYSHRADPPIRIVVDRGRITLYGTVVSAVDRALLGQIARETRAFGVDNQLKLEGEEQKEPRKASSES